jgi:hypothetical protein
MPNGKAAGERCINLSANNQCQLFGKPERPAVCSSLQPSQEMCGDSAQEALTYLSFLEQSTRPATQHKTKKSE